MDGAVTWILMSSAMTECDVHLGMEDGGISDSAITASSRYTVNGRGPSNCQASHGRLNYPGTSDGVVGGWCPATKDVDVDWLQVDLERPLQVEGVIIQGSVDPRGDWSERVTEYQVQYSNDTSTSTWQYVTQSGGAQTFLGNSDQTTPVISMFDQPIKARYIRIVPTAFNKWPSMRIELIGCKSL